MEQNEGAKFSRFPLNTKTRLSSTKNKIEKKLERPNGDSLLAAGVVVRNLLSRLTSPKLFLMKEH